MAKPEPQGISKEAKSYPLHSNPTPSASQRYSRTQLVASVLVESCLKEEVLLARSLKSKHTGPYNEC